jgi:hypothetical protein
MRDTVKRSSNVVEPTGPPVASLKSMDDYYSTISLNRDTQLKHYL